jgi:hypothetical protein
MISKEEILTSEVRALSWKQPFAELMKFGKVETRTWGTSYRGLVLICASVQPYGDRELIELCGPEQYARILQILGPKWFNSVKRGGALSIGRLKTLSREIYNPRYSDYKNSTDQWEQTTFVKYRPNLNRWHFEDVTPINPFPWKGTQGWKILTQEERERIEPILNL